MEQIKDEFVNRQVGPRPNEITEMLKVIGVNSLDELIDQTVPKSIRSNKILKLSPSKSEHELIEELREIAKKNKILKSYLGQGYFNCITPNVIKRNILENPGWYTQYTPYQSEISQGRLEALLVFQTMVAEMTGLPVANASLLDEGTASAEAMSMAYNIKNRSQEQRVNKFFVSQNCYRQTIDVVKTRANPLDIELVIGDWRKIEIDNTYFGVLVQYPDDNGLIEDFSDFIKRVHEAGALSIAATDLLALALFKSPGEFGFDVAIGNSQRFGVPLGYGGPHAAFFSTRTEYLRYMPGRIIGVSIDAQNNPAYRMTLQTREQHIRREKATSNICTAQALMAIMAGMYAVYHGPDDIRKIASGIHHLAKLLDMGIQALGFKQLNNIYFDTLKIDLEDTDKMNRAVKLAADKGYNIRPMQNRYVGISLDETTTKIDIENLLKIFAEIAGKKVNSTPVNEKGVFEELPEKYRRKTLYLQHPVFSSYHSETAMMRYIKSLENKDLSLTISMIPLGSCTMKLNPATTLYPISWHEFANIHPFAPVDQAEGYQIIFKELEKFLCEITGFSAVSFQPNSGAQGELTGMLIIRAYHKNEGQAQRDIVLIPSSAHGTNPASATMAGLKIVTVNCNEKGDIDIDDLRKKAEENKDKLAALMVTYPSTHGIFEEQIIKICNIVHLNGGLVYMDGANLNAMVGLTSPAEIGADLCHINLHKTFGLPHGGGGPGAGPVCVSEKLAPFLPGHSVIKTGNSDSIGAVASSPWGSANIILIAYAYIKLLGAEGLTTATKIAILNANYLKSSLEKYYKILYKGERGRVGHEFILDVREFKDSAGIEAEDIAKRLADYSFHAPTVSFPVHGTLMIEPTESEPKEELDRFIEAMVSIRKEIQEVIDGKLSKEDNPLKNSPHTISMIANENWNHKYSREQAVFPVRRLMKSKFWPSVARVNNTYGDRNVNVLLPSLDQK